MLPNYRKSRKNSRTASGVMIVLVAITAFFVLLPLGLFSFEIARVYLAQQQLKLACDSACLGASLAMSRGGADRSARANELALVYLRRNSICSYPIERVRLGSSGEDPRPGDCILQIQSNEQAREITATVSYGFLPVFGKLLGLTNYKLVASSKSTTGSPRQDIVVVLDCSGSMEGEPIRNAKDAVRGFVNQVYSGDDVHFGFISYATYVGGERGALDPRDEPEADMPRPRSPRETATFEWLSHEELDSRREKHLEVISAVSPLRANGQTNTGGALQAALNMVTGPEHRPDAKPVVVLVTDGLPTDGPEALQVAQEYRRRGVTLHSIGFFHMGNPPNLVNRLREAAGGDSLAVNALNRNELVGALDQLRTSEVSLTE